MTDDLGDALFSRRRPSPPVAYPGAPSDDHDVNRVKVSPPHENTKQALRVVLGERCAEARRRLRHTQRSLAKDLGMSASWVREYEGGAQFAPAWLIATLAEAIGVRVGWFYGYGGGK